MTDDYVTRVQSIAARFNAQANAVFHSDNKGGMPPCFIKFGIGDFQYYTGFGARAPYHLQGSYDGITRYGDTAMQALEKIEQYVTQPGNYFYDRKKYDGDTEDGNGTWPPQDMWAVQADGNVTIVPYDEASVRAMLDVRYAEWEAKRAARLKL